MEELKNNAKELFKYESTCYFCKKKVKSTFPDPGLSGPVRFICNDCLYSPDRRKLVIEALRAEDTDTEVIS